MGRIITVSDGAGQSVTVSNWGVAQSPRHRLSHYARYFWDEPHDFTVAPPRWYLYCFKSPKTLRGARTTATPASLLLILPEWVPSLYVALASPQPRQPRDRSCHAGSFLLFVTQFSFIAVLRYTVEINIRS
jgi:hypothetical protein